jgi:glycosyltransferase involved in cell wall biosynthesis
MEYTISNGDKLIRDIFEIYKSKSWNKLAELWDAQGKETLLPYTVFKAFYSSFDRCKNEELKPKAFKKTKKLLSILTINYNNEGGLRETVESVLAQTDRASIQYIVIDGASTDKSLDYLRQVASKIDVAVFGTDKGIYDAMNRGLEFVNSEYTLFLNSGDCLSAPDVVAKIKAFLNAQKERPVAAYGPTLTSGGNQWPCKPSSELWKGMICSHQSILIDTDFLTSIGFSLRYKIVSDFEVIYRTYLTGRSLVEMPFSVSKIEDVGVSSDFVSRTLERWQVVRSYKNKAVAPEQIDVFYQGVLNGEENKGAAASKVVASSPAVPSDVEKRIVFLISMPRSGSTMLQKILDRSSAIGTVGEPWVMLPLMSMYDPELVEAKYGQLLNIEAAGEFVQTVGDKDLILKAQRQYADQIYSAILDKLGTERFLDKTPRYVHIVDKLADLYPNAKFIVLLRNPGAIISSYAHTWAGGNFHTVKKTPEYMYDFTHGFPRLAEFATSGRSNMHVVKYEDLVANPEEEVHRLFDYLELPFSGDLVNYGSSKPQEADKYALGDPGTVYQKSKPDASHSVRWLKDNENVATINFFQDIVRSLDDETVTAMGYSKATILNQLKTAGVKPIDVPALVKKYGAWKASGSKKIPAYGKSLGVLITCFNNENSILQTLQSVISQSKKPDLVVVADDCSEDGSVGVIKELIAKNKAANIRLIARPKNVGVAANRDLAIKLMDVDFISTIDGDDLFYPGKLEAEWRTLKGNETHVAFSDILMVTGKDKEHLLKTEAYNKKPKSEITRYMLTRVNPVPRDMMFSKALYLKAEGFDHGVSIYEDWALKQRLIAAADENGWLHSGAIGTIYDRRAPGLSGKPPIYHAFGELIILGRNIEYYCHDNSLVVAAIYSIMRHLKGPMKERAENFLKHYPVEGVVPEFMADSLLTLWRERGSCESTEAKAQAIWQFFSPPLEVKK